MVFRGCGVGARPAGSFALGGGGWEVGLCCVGAWSGLAGGCGVVEVAGWGGRGVEVLLEGWEVGVGEVAVARGERFLSAGIGWLEKVRGES